MGCMASKHDINDLHANIFQVINVNELGHRFSAAKLEVTDTELVLHQRGKTAIRWPLRCLRRYGFDAHKFSFESGRRCPTGPGIYSFKCQRAEALFNMLQLQIQNITEDAASRDINALPPPVVTENRDFIHDDPRNGRTGGDVDIDNYLEPVQRPHRVPNIVGGPSVDLSTVSSVSGVTIVVEAVSGNVGGGGVSYGGLTGVVGGGPRGMGTVHPPASPTTPLSPPPLPLYENSYTMTRTEETPPNRGHDMRDQPPTPTETIRPVFVNHIDKTVVYDNCSGRPSFTNSYPSSCISLLNSIKSKRPKSYVNINKSHNEMKTNDQVYVNIVPEHVYVNFGQEKDVSAVHTQPSLAAGSAGSGSSHSGTTTTTDTDQQPSSKVNYIILDLDPNSDSSQAPPVSPLESVVSGTESPHRSAERYVTIDFGKTLALMDTAKATLVREDGSRKTRHNSTFTNPATQTHHNSSLSD